MIGNQDKTLERLELYSRYVQECRDRGAEIIVPHQGGRLSLEDFTVEVDAVLDFDDYIVGFPMKRGVTKLVTLKRYCETMQPGRVHLLGIGPRRREPPKLIDCLRAIEEVSPGTEVFCDSVLLRGMRERTKKLRPLTRAEDEAVALLRDRLHGAPPESIPVEEVLASPEQYLGHVRWRLLRESWEERGLREPQLHEVEQEWRIVTDTTAAVIWRRRESIRRVLCPGAYDPGVTEAEARRALEGPPRPKRSRR